MNVVIVFAKGRADKKPAFLHLLSPSLPQWLKNEVDLTEKEEKISQHILR
jgi:hypothetical protein